MKAKLKAFIEREKRKWLFGYSKTRIVDLMLNFINKNSVKISRILDVGCGSGRNSIALAKMGFEVYGIDFVKEALNELEKRARKEKVKVKTICHNITKSPWPLKNNFFDAAIINVVLDSIDRSGREVVAKELHRILKKSAYVFIYEPSIKDGYYSRFVKNFENPVFTCPDDGIKREIFAENSLAKPFRKFFKVIHVEERRYKGKCSERNMKEFGYLQY